MSDIVEELRQCAHFRVMTPKLLYDAADEVVRLREALTAAQSENERLRKIVIAVSETDDVAKAYQQVYFEDERRWQVERDRRIQAEARLAAAVAAASDGEAEK